MIIFYRQIDLDNLYNFVIIMFFNIYFLGTNESVILSYTGTLISCFLKWPDVKCTFTPLPLRKNFWHIGHLIFNEEEQRYNIAYVFLKKIPSQILKLYCWLDWCYGQYILEFLIFKL
jgi:hypothetical protein